LTVISRPRRTIPLFPYTTLFRSPHSAESARSPERAGVDRFPAGQERELSGRGDAGRIPGVGKDDCANARSGAGHLWAEPGCIRIARQPDDGDRKSTRLNSSHGSISYAVFCLKNKKYEKTESIQEASC